MKKEDDSKQRTPVSSRRAATAASIIAALLMMPPVLQSVQATHYQGEQHFPNAYLHEQDGDSVKLRKISHLDGDNKLTYVYRGPNGEDHNPAWADQTTLRFGQQFSLMIPQPKDGSLKMPVDVSIIIEGPGNDDDFRYSLYQTGWIQRTGDAYKFTGYQRMTFMLDAPDSLGEEDWTMSEAGKGGMLVWLDLGFEDGTSMRYLLVAKIAGYDCESRGWEASGSGTACLAPTMEAQ